MPKKYGGRWEIASEKPLGQGGQAHVFRVTDALGEYRGEYALKRVLNPERHDRFRREIEAVKTVTHPNIIRLVDHSALGDPGGEMDKQFIVMPIAEGGDLGQAGRVQLYKNSVDGVVEVGKQLASALSAAHQAGVIHRDVKPANILFTGMGHQTWLSDFGICLLRGSQRLTETGEVVGPRSFLAPELEDGNQLEVTPAADIYSLGKVLYYMISGGITLPRERLDEERYNKILMNGERQQLLYSLLRQMVCPLVVRIADMSEVSQRLTNIETWEKEAQVLALSPTALASIQRLRLKAQENARAATVNTTARQQEAESMSRAKDGFENWLRAELEMVAVFVNDAGILKCSVVDDRSIRDVNFTVGNPNTGLFVPIGGLGLCLEQTYDPRGAKHFLYVRLCRETRMKVTVSVGPPKPQPPRPAGDFQLAMIPCYQKVLDSRARGSPISFLTRVDAVGQIRGVVPSFGGRRGQRSAPYIGPLTPMTPSFLSGSSQIALFRASEWPAATMVLKPALKEAIESFMAFVGSVG